MRDARMAALKEMLEVDPNDAFALYGLALEYKTIGELELALPLLQKAAALPEPEVYTYYQLGEVFMGLGEMDEAEAALKLGIERANHLNDEKAAHELNALLNSI